MGDSYKSGFYDGVLTFAEYLKEKSFFCDCDNWMGFQAIDMDYMDYFVEKFLEETVKHE